MLNVYHHPQFIDVVRFEKGFLNVEDRKRVLWCNIAMHNYWRQLGTPHLDVNMNIYKTEQTLKVVNSSALLQGYLRLRQQLRFEIGITIFT